MPNPNPKKQPLRIRELLSLLKYTKQYKKQYFLIIIFSALQVVSYSFLAFSIKWLIDKILPQKNILYFIYFAMAWIAGFIIHGIFTVIAAKQRIFLTRNLVAIVRSEIIKKLQVLSIGYFDTQGTGNTATKLLLDMDRIQNFYQWLLEPFLVSIITLVTVIPFLSSINHLLTWITLLYIPLVPVVQLAFKNIIVKKSYDMRNSYEQLTSRLVEFISGIKQIRTFATEDEQAQRISREISYVRDNDITYTFFTRVLWMIIQFFGDFIPIMIWVLACILIVKGQSLTIASIAVYVGLVRNMFMAFNQLYQSFDQTIMASPSVRAISSIIRSDEIEDHPGKDNTFNIDGSIEFKNVVFTYGTRADQNQLNGVSLKINKGEHVAIVGTSGSGKTTFVDVLLGFYKATSGNILHSGKDITGLNLKRLRSQTAIMSQEVFLFNTTLGENIRFASLQATQEEIREACRKAEILDFIESLPKKFDTLTGERGIQLSGGQIQRIGLARVFLRDPQIIILDEPSSALDVLTEKRFISTLYKHANNKTLIIIAHRFSTIKNSDRIYVFDNGKIIEDGTFKELKEKNGLFASMAEESVAPPQKAAIA